MSGADRAKALACGLLARELPSRWAHVQGVARRARMFAGILAPEIAELLVAASYLHDIGYAQPARDTGFHPVDGARFLRRQDVDERIVTLVAHHTCALREAELLDLDTVLVDEFPPDLSLPNDELLYCDLTTGPTGAPTTVLARLADVRLRYAPDTTVHRFVDLAELELVDAVSRAACRLCLPPAAAIGSPFHRPDRPDPDDQEHDRLVLPDRGVIDDGGLLLGHRGRTPVLLPGTATLQRSPLRLR